MSRGLVELSPGGWIRFCLFFFSEINQELTRALHDRLLQGGKKVHVLGVDLDAELVQRANEKQMLTQRPTDVEFQPLDVVTDPQVGSPFSVVVFLN